MSGKKVVLSFDRYQRMLKHAKDNILDSKDDKYIQGISPLNNSELEMNTENDNYSINSTQSDKLSDEINSEDDTGYELFISLLSMSLRERARRLMSFIKSMIYSLGICVEN